MTVPPAETPRAHRRAVLGAAWATPIIATAATAPAFAASGCTALYPSTLSWAGFTKTSSSAGTLAVTSTGFGGTTTLSLSSTVTNYTLVATNFDVSNPVGGTGKPGLFLQQYVNGAAFVNNPANNQTVTMRFNRDVYDLSFIVTDVDSTGNWFQDAVAVTGATFTYSYDTALMSGVGTTASPFRLIATNTNYDNATGTGGNVRLTFPGRIAANTAIRIVYWNAIASYTANPPTQGVFFSEATFSTREASCP